MHVKTFRWNQYMFTCTMYLLVLYNNLVLIFFLEKKGYFIYYYHFFYKRHILYFHGGRIFISGWWMDLELSCLRWILWSSLVYAQSDYSQNQLNQLIYAPYDKHALYPVNKKKNKLKIVFLLSEGTHWRRILSNWNHGKWNFRI